MNQIATIKMIKRQSQISNQEQEKVQTDFYEINRQQIDFSNGRCSSKSQIWKCKQALRKLQSARILHLQKNQNQAILVFIMCLKFRNLKKIILQNNKISNLQGLCFLDSLNLQQIDLSKNKISKIDSFAKINQENLFVIKLSIDFISEGLNPLILGKTSLKDINLDTFYKNSKPLMHFKILKLIKSSFRNSLCLKINSQIHTYSKYLNLMKAQSMTKDLSILSLVQKTFKHD